MASTSDNVDYSFSNDEKLIIHNQNTEDKSIDDNNTSKQGPSSEMNVSIDSGQNKCNNSQDSSMGTSAEKKSVSVDEAITKLEGILQDLKKQKEDQLEDKRIIRDVSNKRSRKNTSKYTSSPRYESSAESSTSLQDRSPSPKRTRKESPRKKYDSDSTVQSKDQRYRYRDSSQDSLSSDRSYSCVSKKLKKELSSFLGNSFVSINSKKNRYSRKNRRESSYDRARTSKRSESKDRPRYSKKDSYDRSRYSRRDYSRDRSGSRRDDSYDRKRSNRRNSERYNNYNRNYQQVSSNDIEERYSRYYAVMYAFSIIMDILRQDDIYSNF